MNRALLVGINAYPTSPLGGCVNDIDDMKDFLIGQCSFAVEDIRLVADAAATKVNIEAGLQWLTAGLVEGDRILFHYSGHGAQMPSYSDTELDGVDEVICPVDFDWTDEHAIRDKEFHSLFQGVPPKVEAVWVSDSCHSGDLYRAMPGSGPHALEKRLLPPPAVAAEIERAKSMGVPSRSLLRSSSELNVALVAGCRSDQTAADDSFSGRRNGALTFYLLESLLAGIASPLSSVVAQTKIALAASNRFTQEPQLEGSAVVAAIPFMGHWTDAS
jgi:hypothetical protein